MTKGPTKLLCSLSYLFMSLSWLLGSRSVAFQKILSGGLGVLSATTVGRSRGAQTRSLKEANENTLHTYKAV